MNKLQVEAKQGRIEHEDSEVVVVTHFEGETGLKAEAAAFDKALGGILLEVVKSGVSAVQFGVSSNVKAGRVVVTPAVNYQVTLRDVVTGVTQVTDENEFWATVGVAYGF